MKPEPKKTKIISSLHRIEVGISTWSSKDRSIRNRYESKSGKFSPHGSSEIPLKDLRPIMEVAAKHDLLDVKTCASIIEILAKSVQRQK